MIHLVEFDYEPHDREAEKASNSYLMSLIALIAGMPLPIINLIATFIFYLGNRNSSYFVRWHCTQALFSQLSLFFINSAGFWWTYLIITDVYSLSNYYIAYIIMVLLFNLTEFIATIYTAVKTRNRVHVVWWFYGTLSNLICSPTR